MKELRCYDVIALLATSLEDKGDGTRVERFTKSADAILPKEMVGEVLNLMKDVAAEGMTMMVVTPEEVFEHPKSERLQQFLARTQK